MALTHALVVLVDLTPEAFVVRIAFTPGVDDETVCGGKQYGIVVVQVVDRESGGVGQIDRGLEVGDGTQFAIELPGCLEVGHSATLSAVPFAYGRSV